MKAYTFMLTLSLIQLPSADGLCAERVDRRHLLMDYDWKFAQSDVKEAENPNLDDSGWRTVNLPHDWSIEGEFREDASAKGAGGYLPTGIGWYRKHFVLPTVQEGQNYWVEFEGVYMNSDVWINGQRLGHHAYGYTSFCYDLTRFVRQGENVLAVRVDNSLQPNSRWYSGSGIYRNVWLTIAGPIHIAQCGTYITTPSVDSISATIVVRTTIENGFSTVGNIELRSCVVDGSGKIVATVETPESLSASCTSEEEQRMEMSFPSLWSVARPAMYTLHSMILEDKDTIDAFDSPFGIRKIEYDKEEGFLLNGEHVKMNGVCLHHDAGCLGAAVPRQAWVRRLRLLKEMGCNAIRTSHNPPSPEFLDLCDRMGFLVMDEAFDEWAIAKGQVQYGYHVYFRDNWKSDLLSMIDRDRNHPSVVLWSAGNEVPDQGIDSGVVTLKELLDAFHKEDPTRPVTVANDHIADPTYPAKLGFIEMQDIVGYNYVDRWGTRRELYYSIDRHDHPDWKMIGTESVSIPGIRGEYHLQSDSTSNPFARSLDFRSNMIEAEQLWKFVSLHDYVIGDFMWTGIDYLGEARWPSKSSSSGVMDLCGFPKDSYYFYQSQWTDKPVLHLFPHWNWTGHEGQVIPVFAYTNCDSVELFLNGKSFGVKTYVFPQQGHSGAWYRYARPFIFPTTSDLHLSWDVPYEAGTLKAVGKKNGQIITEEIHTASEPYGIRLSADRSEIDADAGDIADVRVEILDKNGWLVPDANNVIEFRVDGAGMLAGTDNGNPRDTTPMKSSRRAAFNGLALVVIQSTQKAGTIRLAARSESLKGAVIQIVSRKPMNPAVTAKSLEH